jgi:PAS domain S-box-containing protein
VTHTRNLDELYRVIHQSLGKILNVDNFYIALYHEKRDAISFPYHVDEMEEFPAHVINFSRKPSSISRVIRGKAPMLFRGDQIQRLEWKPEDDKKSPVSKVWVGAPLIIKDRVIGAIVIQSYTSVQAYHPGDLDLLNSVSQHVALAIERKEAEEKIQGQHKILEKILESSPVGISLVQNRFFKWVNAEMVRMFGYDSKTEFQDKNVRMIYLARSDYEFAGKTIYEGLVNQGTADYEMDLVRKDGTLFPAHIRLNCASSQDPMAWTIATFTDISQRKAVEKASYERERLQGVLEMAGAICHEINQPLQAILGHSELLLMDSSRKMTVRSLNSIRAQATRLGKITKKLSNITHYQTLNYPGNTKIVDIWGMDKKNAP